MAQYDGTLPTGGFSFGSEITPDQLRAQYARNAESMQTDADKAHATSKKVRGFTAAQLDAGVANMVAQSQMTDEQLAPVLAVLNRISGNAPR